MIFKARQICIRYIWEQLKSVNPKLVIVLGNTAVQTFLEDPLAEVKNLRGSPHMFRGYKIVAAYHPLAVRRRPNLKKNFIEDLKLAASAIN